MRIRKHEIRKFMPYFVHKKLKDITGKNIKKL
ncbi:hypothetical protein [Cytobacillus sp. FSL M8-0252]